MADAAPSSTSGIFTHVPHPRITERKHEKPPQTTDEQVGFNGRIALFVTKVVGSMWCAYVFCLLALAGLPQALAPGGEGIVAWIAQTFIQLVLLSVIMVGQNVSAAASDKRAIQTYKDAEAILAEAIQLQSHLQAQDKVLDDLVAKLQKAS
jgi:hypothetical protein